jgi:hypothetical protein
MRSTLNDPSESTGPVVVATIRADNGRERARWRARALQLGYTSLTAYITELIRLDVVLGEDLRTLTEED